MRTALLAAWCAAALLVGACTKSPKPGPERTAPPNASNNDRASAPSLELGNAWINVERPFSLDELRGHVVVLDFWTSGCINCMHVLPMLERAEHKYAGRPVAIVGIHSGKFDAEKQAERVALAVRRLGVEHPVIVDSDRALWKAYGVSAWPTLVLLDTEGRIAIVMRGEPRPGKLEQAIDALLLEGQRSGKLAQAPKQLTRSKPEQGGALAYPGKVAVSPTGTVAIADTGHHRIVLVDRDGKHQATIGSGIAGSVDGDYEVAAFRRPQGLAFSSDGKRLYVADTENHQLREIDLDRRRVVSLAGTGERGLTREGGPGRSVALRSPWDVVVATPEQLLVAMAGAHQIWSYDFSTRRILPLAGSGKEGLDDGSFEQASFAQPSGLCLVGDTLYVADAEASAVRALDLGARRVSTLVGQGLFEFGDRDGTAEEARLQHALGIAAGTGELFLADTYNNKLKRLELESGTVETIALPQASLLEPGGLARLDGGRLLVADTNHHRVLTVDPAAKTVVALEVRGLLAPTTQGLVIAKGSPVERGSDGPVTRVKAQGQLGPGQGTLIIDIKAPPHAKLTEGAPLVVEARGKHLTFPKRIKTKLELSELPVRLPVVVADGALGPARVDLNYYWCTEGDSAACLPERASLLVELDLSGDAPGGEAYLSHSPEPEKARP